MFLRKAQLIPPRSTLVVGLPSPSIKFVYRLPIPNSRMIVGSLFPMKAANIPIVQRTWGLLEYEARWKPDGSPKPQEVLAADKTRYGPSFKYDEFLERPSTFRAMLLTIGMALGIGCLMVPPVRFPCHNLTIPDINASRRFIAPMDSSEIAHSTRPRAIRRVECRVRSWQLPCLLEMVYR